MYRLSIPQRSSSTHQTLEEAQQCYTTQRDRSGEGASTFAFGTIADTTTATEYRISYNGRVWNGSTLIVEMTQ
jgi:hypothetical protein